MHRTEQFDIIQKLQHFKDIQDLSGSAHSVYYTRVGHTVQNVHRNELSNRKSDEYTVWAIKIRPPPLYLSQLRLTVLK